MNHRLPADKCGCRRPTYSVAVNFDDQDHIITTAVERSSPDFVDGVKYILRVTSDAEVTVVIFDVAVIKSTREGFCTCHLFRRIG